MSSSTFSPFNRQQQITSCRVVQTSNLTGTYSNGPTNSGVGARLSGTGTLVIDGVTVIGGNRVLLMAQTDGAQNGIYVVNFANGGTWELERSDDFHSAEQIKPGYFIPIEAGTINAGAIFTVIEPAPLQVGVSDIVIAATPLNSGNLKGEITAAYAGGGTSNAFTATGLTAASIVTAVIVTSTNSVAIAKAVPTTDTLTVTFTADPGASTTVAWIALAAAQ